MPDDNRYAAPRGVLVFADWEDLSTLYDRRSGDTHVLDPLSAEALRLLMGTHPATTSALAEELAQRSETEPDATWRERISESLSQLLRIGLIVEHRSPN